MTYSIKNPKPLPSLDVLNGLLSYEPETGVLTWKERTPNMFKDNSVLTREQVCNKWNSQYSGKEAGSVNRPGYRRIHLDGSKRYAHRLAYYMGTGKEPRNIDHINGLKDDNRLSNLRCVTQSENTKNKRMAKNNTSGSVGVYYDKRRGYWRACMFLDKVTVHLTNHETGKLGFTDKIDAIYARYWAERDAGFHENHGRV